MILAHISMKKTTKKKMLRLERVCLSGWLKFTEFPQWFYPQFGSFDNIMYSLALLFEVSALEGWPDVMHMAMDTDDKNMLVVPWPLNNIESPTPMEAHKPTAWLAGVFFVCWIVLGCFVVVNMTIGVVVDTFANIKQKNCLLYTSPSPRDRQKSRMPSSA